MAEVLDDGEFWLPPQFLTDDDLFMDKSKAKSNPKNLEDGIGPFGLDLDGITTKSSFPHDFPYGVGSLGFSSDPGSPVESLGASTETESDEEDYLAGLTRQMARSTLEDGIRRNDGAFVYEKPKGWGLSRSPQSTLCAARGGCGCMQGSTRGSSTCQSRVSSPPGTWDLLFAAAREVARMRMNEESFGGLNSNRGLLGSATRKFSPNVDVSGFYPPSQSLSHQKIQSAHFQILKQQQLMKQQNARIWGGQKQPLQHQQNLHHHSQVVQNRVRSNNNSTNWPMGLSQSAWPPLQQQQQQTQNQNGSGMPAVFLGNPTAKRNCAGTGVFLPRRIGAPTEPRKKPACSTALLPTRVVQALNLNLDEIGSQPQLHPRSNSNFTAETDAALKQSSGGNGFGNQKQRNFRQHQGMNHEVGLPQEWTY